jgi:hypothetical protein
MWKGFFIVLIFREINNILFKEYKIAIEIRNQVYNLY